VLEQDYRLDAIYVPKPTALSNCGKTVKHVSVQKAFVVADYKILCLGLIQSLFEGSMYTFVLEWTPALTPADLSPANVAAATSSTERATIPHGYIFAGFMVGTRIM